MIQPLSKSQQARRSKLKAPARKARKAKQQAKTDRIKEAREKLTPAMKVAIIARDHGICRLCMNPCTKEDPAVVDHIIPLAQFGRVCESNLATLHRSCNGGKRASTAATLTIMRNCGHAIKANP